MFSFINKTWNPLGGVCPHNCEGCWAKDYIHRKKFPKYQGPYTIDKKQINRKFKAGSVIFVCDMLDLFAANVPMEAIQIIMNKIKAQPQVTFLILTRNPRYAWIMEIPENVIIGATIDTDIDYPELTKAPKPEDRIKAMQDMIAENPNNRRFVCVEPIKKFTKDFAEKIISIKPYAVAVGYDNYGNGFPEPSLEETTELIAKLGIAGIIVYKKTLRADKQLNNQKESQK